MQKQQSTWIGVAVAVALALVLIAAISRIATTGGKRRYEDRAQCRAEQVERLTAERLGCSRRVAGGECERLAFARFEAGTRECSLAVRVHTMAASPENREGAGAARTRQMSSLRWLGRW